MRKRHRQKEPFNHHFVRKLFLDFLFDLEHSDVFENIALYDDIYIKLHKNFLFNAIANKAEYYYQRYQQVLYKGTLRTPWDIPQKTFLCRILCQGGTTVGGNDYQRQGRPLF